MEKINKITNDNYIMSEAEALRLDDMFRRSIRKEGLDEGKTLGIEEIIKNMLNNKFDLETISKITSKPIRDIKLIKDNM